MLVFNKRRIGVDSIEISIHCHFKSHCDVIFFSQIVRYVGSVQLFGDSLYDELRNLCYNKNGFWTLPFVCQVVTLTFYFDFLLRKEKNIYFWHIMI